LELTKDFFKTQKEKIYIQPFILGTRAFKRAAKQNGAFAIYVTPMVTSIDKGVQEIPMQHHNFKDVFERKNADILPKYCLYDCTIELQDGAQPPLDQYTICRKWC
jgi:hypothetical protein